MNFVIMPKLKGKELSIDNWVKQIKDAFLSD